MASTPALAFPSCFRCAGCDYRTTLLKAVCPRCGATAGMVPEPATRGRVLDFVPVQYPPENLKDLGAYVSVLVELDGGCRAFGVFRGDLAGFSVGCAVAVTAVDEARKIPFLEPVGQDGRER